jgi:hypothetical protein
MRAALFLCLCILIAACGPALAPAIAITPGAAQGPASGPRIEQPPVSPPAPPGTNLPVFACADAGGGKTGVANLVTARVGTQPGYERFVLQFDSAVPSYTVKRQSSAVFPVGATGQPITLSGSAGAMVRVHSATGANTFSGSIDISHPEYQILKEARQTEDFEGYVGWALGLSKLACMRVFTLTDPARLVVDFSTATS